MKKLLFLTLLTSITLHSFGQKMNGDTLITSTGFKVYVGQVLTLGQGSDIGGHFKSMLQVMTGKELGAAWAGSKMKVTNIRNGWLKSTKDTYVVKLNGGMVNNYCLIEVAIASGELVVDEQYRPKNKNQTVVVNNQLSKADEIVKLKKLLDDGILTKEEFDKEKTKILNN